MSETTGQSGLSKSQLVAKLAQNAVENQSDLSKPNENGFKTVGNVKAGEENFLDSFTLTPRDLEGYLDQYVIKQERAKRVASTKVVTHYRSIKHQLETGEDPMMGVNDTKSNMVLLGPTGVGKSYIVKLIAEKLGVPFVKADATKYSETGYVGEDVETMVRDLVKLADGDVSKAQYGIIFIDEIDKIANRGSFGRDVSGRGVQTNLLKIMEDTDVEVVDKHDLMGQMQRAAEIQAAMQQGQEVKPPEKISTKNILFVLAGAFNGLDDIIQRRMNKKRIGFDQDMKDMTVDDFLAYAKPEDLVTFGFEPEFIGRVPVVATLEHLTTDDLYQILKNPKCPIIKRKIRDFAAYGIELSFTDGALKYFAEEAEKQGTGARSLVGVIEKAMINYESGLPNAGVTEFKATKELVDGSVDQIKYVDDLLQQSDDRVMAYLKDERCPCILKAQQKIGKHGVRLAFADSALTYFAEAATKKAGVTSLPAIVDEVIAKYDDPLIAKTEMRDLELTREMVDGSIEPRKLLEQIYFRIPFKKYEDTMQSKYGITLDFDERAQAALCQQARDSQTDIYEHTVATFQPIESGYQLLKDKTPDAVVTLTQEAVNDPNAFLSEHLRQALSHQKE